MSMRLARRTGLALGTFVAKGRCALGGADQCFDDTLILKAGERGLRTRGKKGVKPRTKPLNPFVTPPETANSTPPLFAWYWNPCRKVIYGENLSQWGFWYPMGNTPARNVFAERGPGSTSALLLGCGDVRNVLESCRQCKTAERKLTFALNDVNSSTIARDVLLLNLADRIDASNDGDVDFLWSVWYNLRLGGDDFLRLKTVVKEILRGEGAGKPWLKIDGRDWEAVATVYRSWLVDDTSLPDVDDVQEMRKQQMLHFLNGRQPVNQGWDDWVEVLKEPSLNGIDNEVLREAGREESRAYNETGSITRDDPGDGHDFVPNVTLLHPESRRWLNHYVSNPFPAYRAVIDDRRLRDAGGLVKACQRRLQEWVVAVQSRTRRASPTLEVSLHCSDALEFCLCGAPSRSFDVIDTSNLADHVGLLNLVVSAGPRLVNKPGSRLNTSTLTWAVDSDSLRNHADSALSFNPKFAPTLLGLRLMTDLDVGQTFAGHIRMGEGADERRLDWQPVVAPTSLVNVDGALVMRSLQSDKKIPSKPEPCTIGVQLTRIIKSCCLLPLGKAGKDNSGLRLSTPTTLALLLKNMESRCVIDGTGAAAPLGSYTDLGTKYCTSFGLEVEKVARLMNPGQGGLVEVRGWLRRDQMLAAMVVRTPIVRVGLVHRSLWDKSTNIELINNALTADLGARHSKDMSLLHLIDNVLVEDGLYVRFLLPANHGLKGPDWEVVLIDLGRPLGITAHSYASLESMEEVAFEAPIDLAVMGVERANDAANKNGLKVVHFKEYGNRFVASVSYEAPMEDAKFFSKFTPAKPGEPDLSVEVGFQFSGSSPSLTINFPFPVTGHEATFKRQRSKQRMECIFPKSSLLPTNVGDLELIDVSNLPEFNNDEVELKMGLMFSIQEMMYKQSTNNPISNDPYYDLRNTIQIMFMGLVNEGTRAHFLHPSIKSASTGKEPIMSILIHGPIRCMDDGDPVLLVSYVDHEVDLKDRMKSGGFSPERFAVRFQMALEEFGERAKDRRVIEVGEGEVILMRKLLAENSARLKPSPWQAKHVADDSEWRPSFLKPMYPENVKMGHVGSRELRDKVEKMSMEDAMKELVSLTDEKEKAGSASKHTGVSTNHASLTGDTGGNEKKVAVMAECRNCGAHSGLKRCSGCGKAWYCGRDCQKQHWGVHKHQCMKG